MILCTFRCLASLIAAGLPAANGLLIIEGHTSRIISRPSTTSSCMLSSELQKKTRLNNWESPWGFLPGLDQDYRRVIWKAVKQNERELQARKEEAKLIAKGKFVRGRRLVQRVWDTTNQDEHRRAQKQKERNSKIPQPPHKDDHSATQTPRTTLPIIPIHTPDHISENPSDNKTPLCEKWDKSSVSLITGIIKNPPLLKLATEAINSIPTFLGRYIACEIWNGLYLIQEYYICAEAVTYVLQQKSLTHQRIVADVWCEFLAKIVDPRLRSRVVTNVMNQEIANIKAVSCAWRLLLAGDNSMFAGTSTIPEDVIATMEEQSTLEELMQYSKLYLRSQFL